MSANQGFGADQGFGPDQGFVVALSGGVGGAKLALGLYRVLPPGRLIVIANTGDDFEHLGLAVSPDLDTLLYTLAGLDNPVTGWGRRDETWTFMAALEAAGRRDLVQARRRRPRHPCRAHPPACRGRAVVGDHRRFPPPPRHFRAALADERRAGAHAALLRRGLARFPGLFRAPAMRAGGAGDRLCRHRSGARPSGISGGARRSGLAAVVICPSNPFISIDPILALPGVREALRACHSAGRRGIADHRRPCGQRPDRKVDGRARAAGRCRRCRRAITAT